MKAIIIASCPPPTLTRSGLQLPVSGPIALNPIGGGSAEEPRTHALMEMHHLRLLDQTDGTDNIDNNFLSI